MVTSDTGRVSQVYSDLQQLGLSQGAAAGVVGNLVIESGVNPNGPAGDNGTSHGIAQWHNSRWTALLNWASSRGEDPKALDTQEEYLVTEMKSTGVWDNLTGVTDPSAAASIFMTQFEKPAPGTEAARQQVARDIVAGKYAGGLSRLLPWNLASAAGSAVSNAASSAGSAAVSAARPLVIESIVALLGLALVGAGVVTAVRRSKSGGAG